MTDQMRIFELFHYLDIIQFDVEVLVDRLEDTSYGDVVLQLDRHLMIDEGFEEADERAQKSESGVASAM